MPEVVNRHHWRGRWPAGRALYVGRPGKIARGEMMRGALDGPALGNPYRAAEHGRATLDLYRKHLWRRIQAEDPAVLEALGRIEEGTLLVCSCAPGPCHGDVIVRAWSWLQSQCG